MALIPALGRQRQADLCEFEASLVHRASSRTARTVNTKNSVSKNQRWGEHPQTWRGSFVAQASLVLYKAQSGLKLRMPLSQCPTCWEYTLPM